jgi:3-oxoacyl-[acyl-carrier-protein] synthase II
MASLGIAVADWEAISPLGIGASAFRKQELPQETLQHPLHTASGDFPTGIDYRPAYFNVAELLGSKGVRTMDRTTALAVCTAKLLHCDRPERGEAQSERVGFAIGTSTGSINSTSDFTRDSLIQERPFLVNPALFPNTVMNCAAGQCGIWFKARSVNATISGGRLSGLLSIKYASLMLRRRYADTLFTGGVEEMCPQSAWAHATLVKQGRRHPVPLGEGCAMFALERTADMQARGETPVAQFLALQYGRYFDPFGTSNDDPVAGVIRCIDEALAQCGLAPKDIGACSLGGCADVVGSRIEHQAIDRLFGREVTRHGNDLVDVLGDTYSAGFSLGLGRLMVSLGQQADGRVGIALTTADDGHVGCLVVRV